MKIISLFIGMYFYLTNKRLQVSLLHELLGKIDLYLFSERSYDRADFFLGNLVDRKKIKSDRDAKRSRKVVVGAA